MSRRTTAALCALLALGAVACSDSDDAATTTSAADATTTTAGAPSTTAAADDGAITVRAGINDPDDVNVAVLEYLPESITVEPGTTVRWALTGPEPHSVTFLGEGAEPPSPVAEDFQTWFEPSGGEDGIYTAEETINSGLAPLGPEPASFELTFEDEGEYTYFCVIHPEMTGTVTVAAEGVDTQADIDARGDEEAAIWLDEGRAAKAALVEAEPRSEPDSDGEGTTWYVEMGTTTEHTDVLAFAPTPAEIAAGDSVVFINNSMAPHTATFVGESGEDVMSMLLDGRAAEVVPGPSPVELNATDFFNTGELPPAVAPEPFRMFRFDVPEAGSYGYVCILHVPSNMTGTIEVS